MVLSNEKKRRNGYNPRHGGYRYCDRDVALASRGAEAVGTQPVEA